MLVVEVARGGKNTYGHTMHGWKVMTGGIPVARMNKAKDARRFAKNLRKLYGRQGIDDAAAAALLAVHQMKDDNDLWEEDNEYFREMAAEEEMDRQMGIEA
jgi:hypothetical protein